MRYLIIFLMLVGVSYAYETEDYNLIGYYMEMPLTPENFAQALMDFEIKYPEIAYRQAVLESGNFKSKLTSKGKNLFGMRRNKRGWCSDKMLFGHAKYQYWIYSVLDYKEWQGDKVIHNYYNYLIKRGYNNNIDYIEKLKAVSIPKNIKQILNKRLLND